MEELTFGQRLVGLTFNPSGDEKVIKAKQLFADAIDLVGGEKEFLNDTTTIKAYLKRIAIDSIILTQMAVVKYLTWKE